MLNFPIKEHDARVLAWSELSRACQTRDRNKIVLALSAYAAAERAYLDKAPPFGRRIG